MRLTPWLFGMLLLALAAASPAAAAPPYRPASDTIVLERLPTGMFAGRSRSPAPGDPAAAAALAQAHIEQARRTGDPRFLGYAEGLLQGWRDDPAPPPPVLLLRATLKQARHDFAGALDDLDSLLAREPNYPQALLTRATLLRVQGHLPEAAQACERLRGRADDFVATLCAAAVRGLRGDLAGAARVLEALGRNSRAQRPEVRAWLAAERAAMAERQGQPERALALYAGALATGAEDPLLRAAAADVLLEMGRPEAALHLVGEDPPADVLALRSVLAARALGRPRHALEARLADAHAAAQRRGEGAHLREEARFALALDGDAQRALALAQRNWAGQREPADAHLLLQAALAAGRPAAAAPVREWLRRNGLEDARLQPLLRQLPP